ncbi:pyridoxamine 5'-phosphate oxidase family protein [Aquihabitans sp. G128]|uniref:pyridoxamine 5'-phosphate oxidase family protein n=1 Tax=Aquihabitans sp. G128 TaxID=2849779 RepID=UPI001C2498D4|nr:pyridoxamine 5'-phosphate oxidase family protein [Aquihabitans sp. G128]QXC62220.1 pyridoxamine 5'-phosphate oxidase family protein [Aquihabitans sp. G128]
MDDREKKTMAALTDDDRRDLAAQARRIVAANRYLTLSTADADGRPWVTPVYFTPEDDHRYLWVSSPTARHSRNIEARREVAFAIFDSTVGIGHGEAVYVDATAALVADDEVDAVTATFTARYPELASTTVDDLRGPGLLRLYRAVATETSVLLRGGDPRNAHGIDTRIVVP